jgi:hypothetical protein
MLGIYSVAQQFLASQERLSSMELVNKSVIIIIIICGVGLGP